MWTVFLSELKLDPDLKHFKLTFHVVMYFILIVESCVVSYVFYCFMDFKSPSRDDHCVIIYVICLSLI